jgi:DNA recombination protein RmuC
MLDWAYLVIGLSTGGLIGWLLSWWLTASRQNQVALRLEEELRGQLEQRDVDIKSLREELELHRSAKSSAEARLESAEKYQSDQSRLHEQNFQRLKEEHAKALQDLKDTFKALSTDALKETHPAFLQLAKESFATFQETAKGDLSKRQEAVAGLIKPLEEQLKVYRQQLTESEQARSKTFGELKNHLEVLTTHSKSLSQETLQLRRILSSNQARGRWGEETLRRVVEAAGMSAHCDFVEQVQSGDSKPDMIVSLPGDRVIVVDAKVPELEFVGQIDEADPVKRSQVLSNHVSKLKLTIRDLAGRDYPGQFPNALDYVVLFLPAESLFSAALEADQDLIVWAAERKILIATPASLIALLRSVSVSWKQHAQTENARAIASAAEELYKRVAVFIEHLDKIRAGLDTASGAYNKAVGSYERSIRPSGERMLKLSNHVEQEMKDLPPSSQVLRDAPKTDTA